jgi:hypothetical protein
LGGIFEDDVAADVADTWTEAIERVRLHADLTIMGRLALELARARTRSVAA